MDTYADLIECEDVLLFANAAITATGQREFRATAGEQRLSLDFLHRYIHGNGCWPGPTWPSTRSSTAPR